MTGSASGTDIIFGGVTSVRGSNFADTLRGSDTTTVTEVFDGWAGNDLIEGRGGFDRGRYDLNPAFGSGVELTSGLRFEMALGRVTGRDDLATLLYGQDTLRSVESIQATSAADIYDATGFVGLFVGANTQTANYGSSGAYNEFQGMGGDDLVTGNGSTRLIYGNALAGISADLAAGTVQSIVADAAGIGIDTIVGGVNSLAGTRFADSIEGGSGNEIFFGNGGNDTISGGGGIDTAVFNGPRFVQGQARFLVAFDPNTAGSATVEDTLPNSDGTDTLTGVELIEFGDQIQMNGRVLDISNAAVTFGKTLFGGDQAAGNDLTVGQNGNGRTIDLRGGGTDVLKLTAGGGFYGLTLLNVEQLVALGNGSETVTLNNAVFGNSLLVDLGAGTTDRLNLASTSGNAISVRNVETVMGGGGFDTVTLAETGSPTSVTVQNVETVIGTGLADVVTITTLPGATGLSATLDLGGASDTVQLQAFGIPNATLTLTGVETLTSAGGVQSVTLMNAAAGLSIDLGPIGFQTLNLSGAGNTVTTYNVETINAFGAGNDTLDFYKDSSVNQTINLGAGSDVINLRGTDGEFYLNVFGGNTTRIVGQTDAVGGEHVHLLNVQFGTTYDLGTGTNDTLQLAGGAGFNFVAVQNVEGVLGTSNSDTITVLGNSDAPTVVTAGYSGDLVVASADVDVFRFTSLTDSFGTGQFGTRDQIQSFDTSEDVLDLRGLGLATFEVITNGAQTVLQLHEAGSPQVVSMEIEFQGLAGALTAANVWFV